MKALALLEMSAMLDVTILEPKRYLSRSLIQARLLNQDESRYVQWQSVSC